MDNLDFLPKVLGDEGYYCIVGLKKGSDKPVQKFYSKLEDAIKVAEELCDNGYDSYYALATFENAKSRRTNNVHQLRSLYIDLDCGTGKPYETQELAIKDLKRFCKESGMPKPFLVNSGGGVHAYWPLDNPVSRDEWLPLAEQLKSVCDDYNLYADPVVTADSARILRVPGTNNYKEDAPRAVKIFYAGAVPGSVDTYKSVLGEPIKLKRSYAPRGELDPITKALLGNRQNFFKNIMLKTLKGEGCEQIRYIMEHQATMSEPMWRAGLSIAKYCEDVDKAVERISKGHPDYNPNTMYRKVENIKKGPYTCEKIDSFNPGVCSNCPHWGEIKSPIVLGKEIIEATDEDNIVEDVPADVDQGHTQTYIIPKFPAPYFRGKTGGVYKRIVKQDDEIEVLIYHNDIYVVRRLDDPELGESIVIRLHLPKDGVREFTMPLTAVSSKDEFRKYVAARGVAMVKTDELSAYILAWVNSMQYDDKVNTAHRQFGWVDDTHTSFILGDKEIGAERVDFNPPTAVTNHLFKAFKPKGSLETWKKTMEFYNQPGMEVHQFIIGLSFGSIFTDFTAINAALLHVFSPDSGIGKTTALNAGASIWGDPSKLVLKESDTAYSKMNRAELYNNLFLPLDELTNSSAKDISDFIYPFTSGMQRNRLSMSANQERVRGEPWKLIAVSTGNTSVIEKMGTYKALPKGETMRILEVRALPVEGLNKIETDRLSTELFNNYGHAAVPYLQFVMQNIVEIKALYETTRQKLDASLNFSYMERFYSVLVADAFMGLMMAKRAGLVDYNLKNLHKWVKDVAQAAHVRVDAMKIDPETVITTYLAENYNNILRIKSTADSRAKGKEEMLDHLVVPDATPRGQFVARYEYDLRHLFLYPGPFKEWCVRKQISFEGLLDSMKTTGTKAKTIKKRMGKGTRLNEGATDVIFVDCTGFDTDEEMGKAVEEESTS